jgi:dopamine beta-monooxygenase
MNGREWAPKLAAFCLVVVLLCSPALAHPEYQKRIPNGNNVIGGKWPGVGHMSPGGGDARNPFGLDFAAADHTWTEDLCRKDSDGDLLTNGEELGDPNCVWKPGMTPNRTHHITHPGFAEGHLPPIPEDTCAGVLPEKDVLRVNMTFSNYSIPEKQTTYACQRFDMPEVVNAADHHIIRFDPLIVRRDIVHHLIVFSCTSTPQTNQAWECGLEMPSGCKEFVWGWALGGLAECLPPEAGIPVGANGPKFFVIQMHYNNDKHVEGAVDSSGVQLHITPHLRKYDASVLLSGAAENDIVIPPKRKEFQVVADCPSFCTEQAFPEEGIFVYAYLMHMHLLGKRMWTELTYVNGTKRILGEVPVYDFNAQAWVPLTPPLRLSRGDRLVTHCVYDSSSRNNTTIGGASTEEEMCTANLAYFPRVPDFDLCTNFTDDDGVKMGRCAGFDFFWDTGKKVPICDAEDIPPQAALISPAVLSQCKGGQQCSGLCRQALLTWVRNSGCVERNGLRTVLKFCGPYQDDCNALSTLFNSKCLHLCYSDESSGLASCGVGRQCTHFSCSDSSNNRTIVIAAAVTIASILCVVTFSILAIAKCGRFKRKVEYIG